MVRRRSTVRFGKGARRLSTFFETNACPVCRVRGTSRGDAPAHRLHRLPTGDYFGSLSVIDAARSSSELVGGRELSICPAFLPRHGAGDVSSPPISPLICG